MAVNDDEDCPLCAAKNENGKLTLFQVNLGQAIKLCSRKQCPFPLGTEQKAMAVVSRHSSDIVIKRRKSCSTKTSSRASTCSTSSGSQCSTPNWSPALTSPGLQLPGVPLPFAKSGYIPSPPPPTRVVTLDQPRTKQNKLQTHKAVSGKPSVLQWNNKDALCWLDVILCLLVHCKQLRKQLQATDVNDQSILKTLITAYDQAQTLFQTATKVDLLADKTANLETSVGTITVKTGGGEFSPITCLPNHISHVQNMPNPATSNQDEDDDFFKCLDDLDLDSESTKFDIKTLEDLLEGDISPHVMSKKSPVKTTVQTASITTVTTTAANNKNKDVAIAEASLLLEDVREQTWQAISAKLRCQKGRDDSPVFALPLLLQHSKPVVDLFNLSFTWFLTCKQCGHKHVNSIQKTLTTFPNTPAHFSMTAPCFMRKCFSCNADNQQMNMLYKRLPKVLTIHFVEGLPNNLTWSGLDFTHGASVYKVTGAVQYKTHPDHFVAWLRDPVCKYCTDFLSDIALNSMCSEVFR